MEGSFHYDCISISKYLFTINIIVVNRVYVVQYLFIYYKYYYTYYYCYILMYIYVAYIYKSKIL